MDRHVERRREKRTRYKEVNVNGWYGLAGGALKVFGMFATVAAATRGFVAFDSWRTSLRNRLLGINGATVYKPMSRAGRDLCP